MASLTLMTDGGLGQRFELAQETVTIGRAATNTVALDASSVSALHCAILPRAGRWVIQDQNSTNGTRLNGAPVKEARLRHGDRVGVGDVELIFEDPESPADQTVTAAPFAARKNRRWGTWAAAAVLGAVTLTAAVWFVMRLMGS